ncbi:MAG: TlyA family RNA methyltransferase [Acholeplasmatales bacterium]|nr:TlyA family RNA methyltransferase [Acholeplasmatales bacterium]
MRLDLYLTEKGYFESRNKAKAEIEAGNIKVNDKVITKSSFDVSDNDKIELSDDVMPYVSRGGYKLEAAIKTFNLDFKDKVVLDIGASTGGFTDCSLQNGAKLVYAVDVGSNQLHDKLKNDKRVISYEETNILEFNEDLKPDFIVMDVSFVSIEYLLPGIQKFITEDNSFVCLIKPQFEIGKMHVKNGIVKDKSLYVHILENIDNALREYNLGIEKLILSPILGGSGNREFIALIKKNEKTKINYVSFVGSV